MSTSPYAPLVFWTLGVRDSPNAAASTFALARAVTPELVARAIDHPAVARALDVVEVDRRAHAVRALAVIAGNRQLRHSWEVPLGKALRQHPSRSATQLLGLVSGSAQPTAARILGNALTQTGSPADLVEFVTLLTDWDHLDVRARSAFLIDFYATDRA